ncbi:hypothetical protein [Nostoc sp. NMS7]|uniref:hypothetical protein n=1 Tax=Nostoc sp. NMS7 TaxID=2815391 RepID=UPI0025F3499E|nr:hypothetical protein [Nostoc sp. NMS7]
MLSIKVRKRSLNLSELTKAIALFPNPDFNVLNYSRQQVTGTVLKLLWKMAQMRFTSVWIGLTNARMRAQIFSQSDKVAQVS